MIISSTAPTSTNIPTTPEEELLFTSLRAAVWKEFEGQKKVKHALHISLTAAQKRSECLEHILLYGPPGLGKTTLAHLIAKEMKTNIKITSGPALERSGDLAAILSNLSAGDVLFIDEIHRLSRVVEEVLYPAMEDYALDIVIGKGPSAKTLRIDLPQFTIVGATTRVGLLSAPLRDRFGITHRLEFYAPDELSLIMQKAATKLEIPINEELTLEIARRARGTPRIALKLLKRVRDVAQVHGARTVTNQIIADAFNMLELDTLGLTETDRRLLVAIIDTHAGGPVGVETLAATLSEDSGTVEDVIEPYLLQMGMLSRTSRGRMVTKKAYEHLRKPIPPQFTQTLF